MPAIPLELARVLQTVRRPGDFFATGRIEIFAPKIEVEGVGAISLPLLEAQARQLIAIAEQALPTGAVRRPWSIPLSDAPGRLLPIAFGWADAIGTPTWRRSSPAPPPVWG